MDPQLECEVCEGTNFYVDAGYFYCRECQTQSQEVQEQEFQAETSNVRGARKIKQKKEEKLEQKVTSWECYNIITCSLTQQLIELGAKENLKQVVKCLWLKYLEKLEVLNMDADSKPKLQLINSRRDLQILYGKAKRKRKRKVSSSDESGTTATRSASSKRAQTLKKTALAQAQYEQISQQLTQEGFLMHGTLSNLKIPEKKSEVESIEFNHYSIKELKKSMSKKHYKLHRNDSLQLLQCHKFGYNNSSKTYRTSVHFISPIKIYSILYLGLLIVKDRIQLADLLRFIKEGHLCFNNYLHLFPEEYFDRFLNIQNNSKNQMFMSRPFRVTTAKMMKFLRVSAYIQVPDLVEMSGRYCLEMNLPDSMYRAVLNLISKTIPKLKVRKNSTIIPNYEGRVMSIILFTLKLLYGLDDQTEFALSKYAKSLNRQLDTIRMFDVVRWIEYISHRSLIVADHHLPTFDSSNTDVDSDLLLQYMKSHDIILNNKGKLIKEMVDHRDVLENIKRLQFDTFNFIEFPATLTPFHDYSRILLNLNLINNDTSKRLLLENFCSDSLDFVLSSLHYLNKLNPQIKIVHGGANDNWSVHNIKSVRRVMNKSRKHNRLVPLKIVKVGNDHIPIESKPNQSENTDITLESQLLYEQYRRHIFRHNAAMEKKIANESITDVTDLDFDDSYKVHYNAYERYWLNVHVNIEQLNRDAFENFYKEHPRSFLLVVEECCRILEQTPQELFEEFQLTELFLVYDADYMRKKVMKPRRHLTGNLGFYIKKSKSLW